ncbi:MAG: MMPL family transporter [Planctomycetes bacterium]|nr:MMPL family transporter [Planctomycetota bacterium]
MISQFYRQYSRLILWGVALSFPALWYYAEQIPSNNDIETWLPRDTPVRREYEEFKQDFGAEELIVIGLPKADTDAKLVEAIAGRLDRIPGIRRCWTPARMISRMTEFGVDDDDANARLNGLLQTSTGDMIGIIAILSDTGVKNRAQTAAQVRSVLNYCQLDPDRIALTGAPIIVTELDRLGSQKSNRRFFLITCAISLGLLYYSFGHWGLSLAMLGATLWGIFLNQAILAACGGEMNFILGSLAVMVMIFTLSIAVHVVSYYSSAVKHGDPDPLGTAVRVSLNPCLLSTLTTLLGLVSLNVSTILPVSQFGYAAAAGSLVALLVGLGITPALLTVMPCETQNVVSFRFDFRRWGAGVAQYRNSILLATAVLIAVTGLGLTKLKPDLNPAEFLPRNSRVRSDLLRVENGLTNVDSIEAVVDFHGQKLAFLDQLQQVRKIEGLIAAHPDVNHTLSLASFFPTELPDTALGTARMLGLAQSYSSEDGLIANRQRLWKISARIGHDSGRSSIDILADLQQAVKGYPVRFTGLTPLLKNAQFEIFDGFWQSFTAACLTITIVMILSLRSVVTGLIAMIPNIIPIWLVFGGIGFLGTPVDIGMMMTGSISLGISVDCTFHFLVQYQQAYRRGKSSVEACQDALGHSGEPMLDSTLISALGMLALCMSSFTPTSRFGMLMAAQMGASLLGELVILPALLCLRPGRRPQTIPAESPAPAPLDRGESETELQIHPFPVIEPRRRRRVGAAQ